MFSLIDKALAGAKNFNRILICFYFFLSAAPTQQKPKVHLEGIEITINAQAGGKKEKAKKDVDLDLVLKRQFNRQRKEHQVYLHKVNLICWIGHGNFVNPILNDSTLMAMSLKLLPKNKNHCYPKDKTNEKYFKSIMEYFNSIISLKNRDMYCNISKRPSLASSLALQIEHKTAICRRDFILIFIILLRAIGIQCRMVLSLGAMAPISPPQSELMSLSTKNNNQKDKKDKKKDTDEEGSITKYKTYSDSKRTTNSSTSQKSKGCESKSGKKKQSNTKDNKVPAAQKPNKESTGGRQTRAASRKIENKENSKTAANLDVSIISARTRSHGAVPQLDGADDPDPGKSRRPLRIKALKGYDFSLSQSYVNISENDSNGESPKPSTSSANSRRPAEKKVETKSTHVKAAKASSSNSDKKSSDNHVNVANVPSPKKLRSARPNLAKLREIQETPQKPKGQEKQKTATKRHIEDEGAGPSKAAVATKKSKSDSKKRDHSLEISSQQKQNKKSRLSQAIEEAHESDSEGESLKHFNLKKMKPGKNDKRVLSSESAEDTVQTENEEKSKKKTGIDIWVELYSEETENWIAVDVLKGKTNCVPDIIKTASHPINYVFAWNNDNTIKDVSPRYCPNLNTTTRKLRVDKEYLDSLLKFFVAKSPSSRDRKEDDYFTKIQFDKPLPTSISDFKNHPLYALKRHLLKFEAIYPPNCPTVGFIREEAVYPRDCVYTLQ